MQICKKCKIRMADVMVFSKDKNEKFCRCPKCHGETKHQKISDKELEYGEEVNREINREIRQRK